MTELGDSKKPCVIAIANGKGGVGKTTTTLAIGTILAQRGYKVLFIDLDPQANLTLSLGYKPHDMPNSSGDFSTAGTVFADDTFGTELENLDLVFARSLIINEDHTVLVDPQDGSYYISRALEVVKRLPYDYVVIDCPPALEEIAISTLLISDLLIIPSQADFFSAYALKDTMNQISLVRRQGNSDLPYRILITIFDRRNRIHHSIKNQLNHTFRTGIFKTIIEVDTNLRKTAILGFPTTVSRGVKQYRMVVDELLEYIQEIKVT